ncbi:hypothetical protein D3C71_2105970 [compost metagenome]
MAKFSSKKKSRWNSSVPLMLFWMLASWNLLPSTYQRIALASHSTEYTCQSVTLSKVLPPYCA